jgi:hypothetical protein
MAVTTGYLVATEADLDAAISAISAGGSQAAANTVYVIYLTTDISLSKALPKINLLPGSNVAIAGNNQDNTNHVATLDGGGSQGFVVAAGTVSFLNLTLTAFSAPGGASPTAPSGGGAIYVAPGATVTTGNVTFTQDTATGANAAGGAVFVAQGGTFSADQGTISGSVFAAGSTTLALSNILVTAPIADQTGAHLGSGTVTLSLTGASTLSAANTYTGGTNFSGLLTLLNPKAASTGAITFTDASGDVLAIGAGDAPANVVRGFVLNTGTAGGVSDTIDLLGIGTATATGVSLSAANVLTVTGTAGSAAITLDPSVSYAADAFVLTADGTGGTDVSLVQSHYTANSEAALNAIIAEIDVSGRYAAPGTTYTIALAGNIALTTDLDAINLVAGSTVVIDGGGATIDGGGITRGFFDYAGGLTLENMTIQNTVAKGGAGGAGAVGGGGGAGLGGGLFVAAAGTAAIANVVFVNDSAVGGTGGASGGVGFGGGGGLGGAGGAGGVYYGGGGIGSAATGGSDATSSVSHKRRPRDSAGRIYGRLRRRQRARGRHRGCQRRRRRRRRRRGGDRRQWPRRAWQFETRGSRRRRSRRQFRRWRWGRVAGWLGRRRCGRCGRLGRRRQRRFGRRVRRRPGRHRRRRRVRRGRCSVRPARRRTDGPGQHVAIEQCGWRRGFRRRFGRQGRGQRHLPARRRRAYPGPSRRPDRDHRQRHRR